MGRRRKENDDDERANEDITVLHSMSVLQREGERTTAIQYLASYSRLFLLPKTTTTTALEKAATTSTVGRN